MTISKGYNLSIQFAELESLGYSGFAVAFKGGEVEVVSTSSADKCITPTLLDYLRSTIIVGMLASCVYFSCMNPEYSELLKMIIGGLGIVSVRMYICHRSSFRKHVKIFNQQLAAMTKQKSLSPHVKHTSAVVSVCQDVQFSHPHGIFSTVMWFF